MSKKKPATLTRRQIEQLKNEATWDAMTFFIAVCMDEFGWDGDDIEAFSVRLERYMGAVDEHLLTIEKVKKIIKDTIGVIVK